MSLRDKRTPDGGPQKFTDRAGHTRTVNGHASITPTNYTGNVEVDSITGVEVDVMATGSTVIRIAIQKITGTAANMKLYIAFGASSAAAVAAVDGTAGLEKGMLIVDTPVLNTEYIIGIPSTAQDGGSLAAALTGYSDGVDELVINITQGV